MFFSSPSISPSWECRIKILALPIQTLPSSSKQKSIWARLCKNVQRNPVPGVGLLTVSIPVYLDLRIYTPLIEPRTEILKKFTWSSSLFCLWRLFSTCKKGWDNPFYRFMLSIHDAYVCMWMIKKDWWLLGGSVTLHTVDAEGLRWSGPLMLAVEHIEKPFINSLHCDWSQRQRIQTVNYEALAR